ncbi:MAG: hypothetical protein ABSG30_00845 [Steroidobacteraceae bacterium]|jgi:hypothetical protein
MLIDRGNGPKDSAGKQTKSAQQPRNRWHAVVIVPGAGHCKAAESAKGRRFLSAEAPLLPLRECDAAACTCKYRHHEDRRGASRRSEEARGRQRAGTDRRSNRGRRETD